MLYNNNSPTPHGKYKLLVSICISFDLLNTTVYSTEMTTSWIVIALVVVMVVVVVMVIAVIVIFILLFCIMQMFKKGVW